jgi:hypothetical protein
MAGSVNEKVDTVPNAEYVFSCETDDFNSLFKVAEDTLFLFSNDTMLKNPLLAGRKMDSSLIKCFLKDSVRFVPSNDGFFALCRRVLEDDRTCYLIRMPGNQWETKICMVVYDSKRKRILRMVTLADFDGDEGYEYFSSSWVIFKKDSVVVYNETVDVEFSKVTDVRRDTSVY